LKNPIQVIACRAGQVAICVLATLTLLPPRAARADAPSTQSSSTLQNAGTAVDNYMNHNAPILPVSGNDGNTLELEPGGYGIPVTGAAAAGAGAAGATSTTAPATLPAGPEAKKGEWLIAPLPNYSPTFGWGIIGRLGYIFPLDPKDKVSPPSIAGVFGYYSQNDSWAAGAFSKFFVDEDRYRITAGLVHAELNYDFSGIGTAAGESGQSVPLHQEMTGGIFETLFKVAPNLYVGPKYIGSKMNINFPSGEPNSSVTIPGNEINTVSSGLGVHAQWDTRDSQFFPRKGNLADVDISFHDPAIGDSFAYQVYTLSYNQYFSLSPRQIVAVRGFAQFENGNVPFYALSKFGRGSDLRGYTVGQFQDKQMFAVQAEYRLEITRRIGAVAFGGVGEVMPSISSMTFDSLLPSGGVGLRYVLAEQNHVAIRFDVAWGRDGSQFYLTVGEAF
jgi:hypothetical protein